MDNSPIFVLILLNVLAAITTIILLAIACR